MDLLDFLKTGSLGSLKTGDTRNAVIAFLGAPEDSSVEKTGRAAQIFKYQSLQLFFEASNVKDSAIAKVIGIGVYFRGPSFKLPKALDVVSPFVIGHRSAEVRAITTAAGVELHEVSNLTFGEQTTFSSARGVHVYFTQDCIDSLQFFVTQAVR